MSALVVDASAALSLLRDDPNRQQVREHVASQARMGQPILVPPLFWLEIINVLARRYRSPAHAVVEAVYELEQVGMTTVDSGRPTVLAVIDAVARFGLTSYDAAYLVLAESAGARLLTADAALATAAGDRAILVGAEGGVAEAPAVYEPRGTWTHWRGATAYLAELRTEVERTKDWLESQGRVSPLI